MAHKVSVRKRGHAARRVLIAIPDDDEGFDGGGEVVVPCLARPDQLVVAREEGWLGRKCMASASAGGESGRGEKNDMAEWEVRVSAGGDYIYMGVWEA